MGELDFLTSWDEPEIESPVSVISRTEFSGTLPATISSWAPAMILEIALGYEPTADILARFNVSPEEYSILEQHPQFQKALGAARQDIILNGLTFKRKAAAQAESYLEVIDEIITDPLVPASTRTGAIKDVVRWAGLEPKEEKGSGQQQTQQFNIQIVL
jgi:hypothetical protein